MPRILFALALAFSLGFVAAVAAQQPDDGLPLPPEALLEEEPRLLPLRLFQKILRTEVSSEQNAGGRRLALQNEEAALEESWNATLHEGWKIAQEREEQHRRRTTADDEQGGGGGGSAFVLCDVVDGKNGEDSVATVQGFVGGKMIVSILISLSTAVRIDD